MLQADVCCNLSSSLILTDLLQLNEIGYSLLQAGKIDKLQQVIRFLISDCCKISTENLWVFWLCTQKSICTELHAHNND